MLNELQRYYRDAGILATSFTCPHKERCRGPSQDFPGPKSAFVSNGYARGDLPRLLFISLDPGYSDPAVAKRLPEGVRTHHEGEDVDRLRRKRHWHWYRTHQLALGILREFDPDLTIERVNLHFAHANSAKCYRNEGGGRQGPAILFRNCRAYLRGELEVLQPDIVVTQGKRALGAFETVCSVKPDSYSPTRVNVGGRSAIWWPTHHPRYAAGFFPQFNQLGQVAAEIRALLSSG